MQRTQASPRQWPCPHVRLQHDTTACAYRCGAARASRSPPLRSAASPPRCASATQHESRSIHPLYSTSPRSLSTVQAQRTRAAWAPRGSAGSPRRRRPPTSWSRRCGRTPSSAPSSAASSRSFPLSFRLMGQQPPPASRHAAAEGRFITETVRNGRTASSLLVCALAVYVRFSIEKRRYDHDPPSWRWRRARENRAALRDGPRASLAVMFATAPSPVRAHVRVPEHVRVVLACP